jgi:hypothetical protein
MRASNLLMSFSLVLLLLGSVEGTRSQTDSLPLKVTMCDLYKNPQMYAGQMIEVRSTIVGYRDPILERPAFSPQEPCSASGYMIIALELPQDVKPKPGFDLIRDLSFQKYEESLKKPMRIEATLEGRFDPVFIWQNQKRERVGNGDGYGKKHDHDGRIVLRKLSDVEAKPIPHK